MKKRHFLLTGNQVTWGILCILFAVFSYIGYSIDHTGQIIADDAKQTVLFVILLLATFFFFSISFIRKIAHNQPLQPTMNSERWVFLLLLSNYMFYIFLLYPGSLAHDTHNQLLQFLGFVPLSNANPVAVTFLYGILFKIGSTLSDPNFGVFLGCFAQAILMAYAFSKVFSFVQHSFNSNWPAICTFTFFFILPTWGGAAQTLLKDSLHVAIFVLFFLQFIKMFDKHRSRKDILIFVFWMFAAALTRKASCYIVLVCSLALTLYHKGNHRRFFIILTVVFWLVFFLYENVLIPGIGINRALQRENYSLQLQQIAQVCVDHGDDLSAEDIAIIDSMLDFETIKNVYNPSIADPVKALCHLDGSLQAFCQLYIRLLFRYPLTYLKALILGNWKYFYPLSVGYEHFRSYIAPNNLGIYRADEEVVSLVLKWVALWAERPILNLFIGPGLYTWLTIVAFAVALTKKDKKRILIVLPMIIFTLGMLATPVNGENRYAYPIMALAPLLLACVYAPEENSSQETDVLHNSQQKLPVN